MSHVLSEKIKFRKLPDLFTLSDGSKVASLEDWERRREEIREVLLREEYGFMPEAPAEVRAVTQERDEGAFANKAVWAKLQICFDTPKGEFSFPVDLIVPKAVAKPPVFLHIAFRPDVPDSYLPMEELLDQGFAVANFCYNDVTADTLDESGLASMYDRDPLYGWGKISMWAWAASRVMDYLVTLDTVDSSRVAVVGHSRLGKTALLCGAMDERFSMVISNESGCGGAALNRWKGGERIKDLEQVVPYWFCGQFQNHVDGENEMSFDQHFLLALSAPRALYIASAQLDDWADPLSEFLSAYAASPVYTLYGKIGLVTKDELPPLDQPLQEGPEGYHMRSGSHFFSRTDWLQYVQYRKAHNV